MAKPSKRERKRRGHRLARKQRAEAMDDAVPDRATVNRRRRRAPEQQASPIDAIFSVANAEAFERLVRDRPELLGDSAADELRAMGDLDGFKVTSDALVALVENARGDPRGAWDQFSESMAELGLRGEAMASVVAEIDRAEGEGRFADVIALVDDALDQVRDAGLGILVGRLHFQRALAYFLLPSGVRADNIEQAISGYRAAIALAPDDEPRANILMHAGIAYLHRVASDRAENIEQAIAMLEQSLELRASSTDPELQARTQSNLATAYLRRERGARGENMRLVIELCRAALRHRSPQLNAYDWAHAQIILGEAQQNLAAIEQRDPVAAATPTYEEVLAEQERLQAPEQRWIVTAAHLALARLLRGRATAGAEPTYYLDGRVADTGVDLALLGRAREHLEDAAASGDANAYASDPLFAARIEDELSNTCALLGDDDEAVAHGLAALEVITPTSAPQECADLGFRVGMVLADHERWDQSADVFRQAVAAAEIGFHARLDTDARSRDVQKAGRMYRWGAFALAAGGDAVGAALMLERGRAREMRRRLGSEAPHTISLDQLPGELAEAYRQATARLARTPLVGGDPLAGRHLQEMLDTIRARPGFEDFQTSAVEADLRAAVEPGWPLIYVNPAAWGTVVLVVTVDDDGQVTVDAGLTPNPTAYQVHMHLGLGDVADDPQRAKTHPPSSYLVAVMGTDDDTRDTAHDFDEALPWLGHFIAEPLVKIASQFDAGGVTLVACGPIAAAPLHAAQWTDRNGAESCLLDHVAVRYAPSALVAAVAQERATARNLAPAGLVALGDPTRDLPAAEPEIAEIQRHFATGDE